MPMRIDVTRKPLRKTTNLLNQIRKMGYVANIKSSGSKRGRRIFIEYRKIARRRKK